ncbi:leucine-rich repeat domain, L domain-like protein [Artemisia annua]|uniref:Leucine-rich repeat domain, L domain-like protein n=1 Tax=Artemisia annua TaxID=35608 RepID=A0A2U1KA90_ARTAN|nr:leucine-rich repeat domain, L domain-like protein [Artemisia annua]
MDVIKVNDEVNDEVIQILEKSSVEIIDKVDLSCHQLKFLPEAFGKLAGLTHLNLSNNQLQLKFLPEAFGKLAGLTHLNLSNNQLQVLILVFSWAVYVKYVLCV